ncbi:MAG: hypothetical protein EBR82_57405 [Caulobacteraceae bacterium]|nr:hypothetical protein [Caulobacteraceae bacterium]
MKIPDTNRPVPAAIDGRRWTVAGTPGDLAGATDTRKAVLHAPLADTPTARMVRNHELVHARITPRMAAATVCKRQRVSMEALQWSEDNRIGNFLWYREIVDADAITTAEADTIAQVCGGSERTIAGALLVHWFLGEQRARLSDAFERRGVDPVTIETIESRLESIVKAAAATAAPRRRRRRAGDRRIFDSVAGFKKYTVPLARAFDFEFPEGGGGEAGGTRRDHDTQAAAQRLRTVKATGSWAPVTDVFRPALDRAIKPRRAPGRRFADCGVIPSAVHRLPVDGSIFATKRKVKGGTVLCDASGSMDYCDEDIERLILDAPGATIAFYAGSSPRMSGRIVIGAAGGRAATVRDVRRALPGRDNLIDGPALRWLARQPGPRFWVSDEGVGGVTDFGRGSDSHAECVAICRAAGIKIIPRIGALRR